MRKSLKPHTPHPTPCPQEKLFQQTLISDRWIDLKPIEDLEPHFLNRVLQTGECLYASDECQ
ncbi:hypothetical protein [Microcystis sp. LEGE 08355]|jgi:hypothetical protein|uniref:hypothetical protein n=1 Tax=Microcystis sp. LEGE 08355 TaxID=1828687 RepID=UPI001D14EB33|nr:hypothetical protein [Microcystis sp. LEGE 08355]